MVICETAIPYNYSGSWCYIPYNYLRSVSWVVTESAIHISYFPIFPLIWLISRVARGFEQRKGLDYFKNVPLLRINTPHHLCSLRSYDDDIDYKSQSSSHDSIMQWPCSFQDGVGGMSMSHGPFWLLFLPRRSQPPPNYHSPAPWNSQTQNGSFQRSPCSVLRECGSSINEQNWCWRRLRQRPHVHRNLRQVLSQTWGQCCWVQARRCLAVHPTAEKRVRLEASGS
jgi:hypothetical protein